MSTHLQITIIVIVAMVCFACGDWVGYDRCSKQSNPPGTLEPLCFYGEGGDRCYSFNTSTGEVSGQIDIEGDEA